MLNDTDLIPIVCCNCNEKFSKEIGWLKNNIAFQCRSCGHSLQHNIAESVRVMNEQLPHSDSKLVLIPNKIVKSSDS